MDSSKDSSLRKRRKKHSFENTDLADLHRIEQEQKMVKDLLPGYKVCSTPSLFDACIQTEFPVDDKDTMSVDNSISIHGALSGNASVHSSSEEDLPTVIDDAYLMPDFIGIKFSQKVQVLLKDTKKTSTVTLNLENMDTDEIVLKVSEWPIGDMYLSVGGYEIFPKRAPDLPYYISVTTEYRKFSLEEAMLFGVDPQHAERERAAWRQMERRERKIQDRVNSTGKTDKAGSTQKIKSVQVQTLVQINPNIITNEQSDLFKEISEGQGKNIIYLEGNLLKELGSHKVTKKDKLHIPETAPSTSFQSHVAEGQKDSNEPGKKELDHDNQPSPAGFEIESQLNSDLAKLEEIIANIDSEIKKQASAVDSNKTFQIKPEIIEAITNLKSILNPGLPATKQTEGDINEQETLARKNTLDRLPDTFAYNPQTMEETPHQKDALRTSVISGSSIATSSQFQSQDTYDPSKPSIFSLGSRNASSLLLVHERGTSMLKDPKENWIPEPSSNLISKARQLENAVAESQLLNDPHASGSLSVPKGTQIELSKPEASLVTSSEQHDNNGAFNSSEASKVSLAAPATNNEQYQSDKDPHQLQNKPARALDPSKPASSSPSSDSSTRQLEGPETKFQTSISKTLITPSPPTESNSHQLKRRKAASQISDSFELSSSSSITSSQQTRNGIGLLLISSGPSPNENSHQIQNSEEAFQASDNSSPQISPSLPPASSSKNRQSETGSLPIRKSSLSTALSSTLSSQEVQSEAGKEQESDPYTPLIFPFLPPGTSPKNRQSETDLPPIAKSSPNTSGLFPSASSQEPQSEVGNLEGPDTHKPLVSPLSSPSSSPEHQQNKDTPSILDPSNTSPELSSLSSSQQLQSSFRRSTLVKFLSPNEFLSESSEVFYPSESNSFPTTKEPEPALEPGLSPVSSQQFQNVVDPYPALEPARLPWPSVPPSLSRYYPRRDVESELLCQCSEGLCIGELRPVGMLCRAKLMDFHAPLAEVQRELMRPYVSSPPSQPDLPSHSTHNSQSQRGRSPNLSPVYDQMSSQENPSEQPSSSTNRGHTSGKPIPAMTADPEDFLHDNQGPSSSKK